MNLLEIVQDSATILGLSIPPTVIGSRHPTAKLLLAYLHEEGRVLTVKYAWENRKRLHNVILEAGREAYPLPADFERPLTYTAYDQSREWKILGPVDGVEWQRLKRTREVQFKDSFRLWTWNDDQIYISEIPDASRAGQVISFEYLSKSWIRPQRWEASTGYNLNDKVWVNGERYLCVVAGISGTTVDKPVQVDGTTFTGSTGIQWQHLQDEVQTRFYADTDIPLVDSQLLALHIQKAYYAAEQQEGALQRLMQKIEEYEAPLMFSFGGKQPFKLTGTRYADTYLAEPFIGERGLGEW